MERLEDDLAANAADLAIAQVQVVRRLWLSSELEQALGGQAAPPAPLERERRSAPSIATILPLVLST